MKNILIIFLVLMCCVNANGQTWPQKQSLGTPGTLVFVPPNGGLQAVLVPQVFLDTNSANAVIFVRYTPGAIIRTSLDGLLWKRSELANEWVSIYQRFGYPGEDVRFGVSRTVDAQGLKFVYRNLDTIRFDGSAIDGQAYERTTLVIDSALIFRRGLSTEFLENHSIVEAAQGQSLILRGGASLGNYSPQVQIVPGWGATGAFQFEGISQSDTRMKFINGNAGTMATFETQSFTSPYSFSLIAGTNTHKLSFVGGGSGLREFNLYTDTTQLVGLRIGHNSNTFAIGIDTVTGHLVIDTTISGSGSGGGSGQFGFITGNVVDQSNLYDSLLARWSLNGNTGTSASTNFIGTKDAQALSFRTNNSLALQIPSGGIVENTNTAYRSLVQDVATKQIFYGNPVEAPTYSFGRYKNYPISFNQYSLDDGTLVNNLSGITSLYFRNGLVLKGSSTPITSSYLSAYNYGYLIQENTSQRLLFKVLDSSSVLEIGVGIKGSGVLNPRDQYSYISGTLGDSAGTTLQSIQTTAGDNQSSTGVLVNIGDVIEITVNQWADSIVTFYRNTTNNNSIRLVRPILTTNSGSSTRMGYPTVFFSKGHVRLIDWSVYQTDFDYMMIGNSITVGHNASNFDTTFVGRLSEKTSAAINNTSKSSATTQDYLNIRNDFNFRNKVVFLSGIIGNDPQGGITSAQSKINYAQIVDALKSRGNRVVHLSVTYRTTFLGAATWSDLSSLNRWLDTAYGAVDKVIQLDTVTAAMLSDGVHLNDAGMATVYNSIYRDASEYFERGYNPQTIGRTPIYGSQDMRIPYDSVGVLSSNNRFFWNRSNNSLNVNGISIASTLTGASKYRLNLVSSLTGTQYVSHTNGDLGLVIQRASASTAGANLYFFKNNAADYATTAAQVGGQTGTITFASPNGSGTVINHYQVFNQTGGVNSLTGIYSGLFFSSSDTTTLTNSVTNGFTYNTMTHILRGLNLTANNKGFEQTNLQSFNTTGGALTNYNYHTTANATRSAGANDLTNVGIYSTASGGQLNYAAIFDAGNVGMGITTPNASAKLDISSTTQGFLAPRMTGVQMAAVSSPASGLLIYNTDSLKHCYYNGSTWVCYGTGSGGGGSGTVTSISAGFGTSFSTITTTGSIIVDSTSSGVLSFVRGAKIADSLGNIIATKVSSVAGTSNRITVTGTTSSVVDIAATYVGQTSIITVGTITTGTWNATAVSGQYGGTGVANTGKTISVSGNTVIGSSTHTVSFNTSANTSITLPTTGTVATLAGTETFTNKTITTPVINGGSFTMPGTSSGVITIATQATAGTWTFTLPADNGNSGDVLQTDGSGVTSWVAPGTGQAVFQNKGIYDTLLSPSVTGDTLFILTPSVAEGFGINVSKVYDDDGLLYTVAVDTFLMATRLRVQKGIDSVVSLIGGAGVSSITGTANQVIASAPTGAVTLSLPQSIATTSTPQFAGMGLGTSASSNYALTIGGTFSGGIAGGILSNPTVNGANAAQTDIHLFWGTFVEPGSGNVPLFTQVNIATPSITTGAATVADAAALYIQSAPPITVTGNTYAIWVVAGDVRFDGSLILNSTLQQSGSSSGVITFQTQAAAGTYNMNWPTTAGNAGEFLTSQGGSSTAMTWTTPDDEMQIALDALGTTHIAGTVGMTLAEANTSQALTDGQLKLMPIVIRQEVTLTGVKFYCRVAASGVTQDNENRVGLYSYSGGTYTLVASSANNTTLWTAPTSNSVITEAFSSTYAASPGVYFIGFIYNQSVGTQPSLAGPTNVGNIAQIGSYYGFTNSAKLYSTVSTATLSSSISGASLTTTTNLVYASVY